MNPATLNPALAGTPGYLVTLRDMLEFSLPAWIKIQNALTELRAPFNSDVPMAFVQDLDLIAVPLRNIAAFCLEMQLEWTHRDALDLLTELRQLADEKAEETAYTEALLESIEKGLPAPKRRERDDLAELTDYIIRSKEKLTPELFRRHASRLFATLDKDLARRVFLSVDSLQVRFYQEEYPLGKKVADQFQSALIDSQEAGKCLALDRLTACVFHLMRVMEIGLKAVAKTLGVPHQNDWGHYIREINQTLSARKPANDEEAAFYREVVSHLHTIKTLWRNPTMHAGEFCKTRSQAEAIFNTVQVFMEHLATRVSE
jgi:hypothetical protein